MAGVDFEAVLSISTFLICLYLAGRLCKMWGLSPVIGEMVVGMLLGPNVADFVPYADFFKLSGIFGVTLMIFESGMHLDFQMLRVVGLQATVVAILGTLLPLAAGMFVIYAIDSEAFPIWPVGLAVGTSLAPTSVGMALKMLGEAHQLEEKYGQLIVMAAFIDDILSLVGLTMLMEIGKATATGTELSIAKVLTPLFASLGFCAFGAMLAYPKRNRRGFVNRYLLFWVGFWPQVIPPAVEAIARLISSKASLLHTVQSTTMDRVADIGTNKTVNEFVERLARRASLTRRSSVDDPATCSQEDSGKPSGAANGSRNSPSSTSSPTSLRSALKKASVASEAGSVDLAEKSHLSAKRVELAPEAADAGAPQARTPSNRNGMARLQDASAAARVLHKMHDIYHEHRVNTLSHLYAPKSAQPGLSVLEKHKRMTQRQLGKGTSPRAPLSNHHPLVKRLSTLVGDAAHHVVHEISQHVSLGSEGSLHEAHDHHQVVFDLRERVLLMMMFALLLGYGWLAQIIGSHLLGAFIAGVSFCWMEHHAALVLWHSQVKRIASWLVRLFFGASVAFAIPIQQMMDGRALAYGMLLGIGPCVATKVFAGFPTWKDKWIVGFAMVGRGEFAYLVAQTAQAFVLNPASSNFAQYATRHAADMVLTSKGSYIYQGQQPSGRMLASSSGDGESSTTWCKHCNATSCDELPVPGQEYWVAGPACNAHSSECDCEMMMTPRAFSICVWALLLASIVAPIGFGLVLRQRVQRSKLVPSRPLPNQRQVV